MLAQRWAVWSILSKKKVSWLLICTSCIHTRRKGRVQTVSADVRLLSKRWLQRRPRQSEMAGHVTRARQIYQAAARRVRVFEYHWQRIYRVAIFSVYHFCIGCYVCLRHVAYLGNCFFSPLTPYRMSTFTNRRARWRQTKAGCCPWEPAWRRSWRAVAWWPGRPSHR